MAEVLKTSLSSDANLKAYYRFESGALTSDSKNSYTLTNNGSVDEAQGKYGGCADFGTANSGKFFTRTDSVGCVNTDNMTISCWLKVRTEPSLNLYYQIVNVNFPTSKYFLIYYHDNNGVKELISQYYGDGAIYQVTLGTSSWYHIVATWDGTNVRLYVNTLLVATHVKGNEGGGENALYIADSITNIYLDDVAIFNRCLTEAEIYQIYKEEASVAFIE